MVTVCPTHTAFVYPKNIILELIALSNEHLDQAGYVHVLLLTHSTLPRIRGLEKL